MRDAVIKAIDSERDYQIQRWGGKPNDFGAFLTFIRHNLGRAEMECTVSSDLRKALETLRKITALGVAAMEQHGAPLRNALPSKPWRQRSDGKAYVPAYAAGVLLRIAKTVTAIAPEERDILRASASVIASNPTPIVATSAAPEEDHRVCQRPPEFSTDDAILANDLPRLAGGLQGMASRPGLSYTDKTLLLAAFHALARAPGWPMPSEYNHADHFAGFKKYREAEFHCPRCGESYR